MVRKIIISSEADRNFTKITEFLEANWTLKEIRKFNNQFDSKLIIIKHFPYSSPVVSHNKNIRKCVINKQISMYYLIKAEEIIVLSLFDTRMSSPKLKV